MSKRILFLGRRDERSSYDTALSMARRMNEAAGEATYFSADLEDLLFDYDGSILRVTDMVSGSELSGFDGIFLLGWFKTKPLEDAALAVSLYAESKGISCLNTEALYTRSRTKLSQYVLCAIHGVRTTPFVFSIDNRHLLRGIEKHSFPVIVKATMASRGQDNYLVTSRGQLQEIVANQPDVPFVMQTFVPNEGDYRLIVMGNTVRMALHRRGQGGSHINNTSQGGQATKVDVATLDPAMLADAVKIARLLRRQVTGVDMIVDKETGSYYLLEANNMPQLSTGSLVAEKMQALHAFLAEEGMLKR